MNETPMQIVTEQDQLESLCQRLAREEFVTVDTEFMRDNSYWSLLCLIQIAGTEEAAAIDPLAPGLDLTPFYELMANPKVLKVIHAGRQDIEIFFHEGKVIPHPIFDTQIAAMVCGFGDSASYEALVTKLTKATVDKGSRFTDWSKRPLTNRQLKYALDDVTKLRPVYERLQERLERSNRGHWLEDEMTILTDPATYKTDPESAWRRLKPRSRNPAYLGLLKALAAWREREAQKRNVPRNRILRDEVIGQLAAHPPEQSADLNKVRGLPGGFSGSSRGEALLRALQQATPMDEADLNTLLPPSNGTPNPVLVELLKVLLKHNCAKNNVAPKLLASARDLERIVGKDDADVPALKGWRYEMFGKDALALKHNKLALSAENGRLKLVPLTGNETA